MRAKIKNEELDLWFVAAVGLLFVFCAPYFTIDEGSNNQATWLALVVKHMDPSWLQRDFFVEQALNFGPRYYFATSLAFLANLIGLGPTLYLVHCLTHILLFVVTLLITRFLFRAYWISFAIVMVLVYTVSQPTVGGASRLYDFYTFPHQTAVPVILYSFYFVLSDQPYKAAFCSFFASLIHPQIGVELGAILQVALLVGLSFGGKANRTQIKHSFFSLVLFFILILIFWLIPTYAILGSMSTEEFFEINIFRQPHHVFPAYWKKTGFYHLYVFLALSASAWLILLRKEKRQLSTFVIGISAGSILFLLIIDYIFTWYIPSKLIMTSQPFRLVLFLKYLGFLSAGGLAALLVDSMIKARNLKIRSWARFVPVGLAFILITDLGKITDRLSYGSVASRFADPRKNNTYDLAELVKETSPNSALILMPPRVDAAKIRLLGERASLVDFKSYPFQEQTMREWYQRIRTAYGNNQEIGFQYGWHAKVDYKAITDLKLREIQDLYGIDFAILYKTTPTTFPERGTSGEYKIVELSRPLMQ